MARFVKMEEFKNLNIGFVLDEGWYFSSRFVHLVCSFGNKTAAYRKT